MLNKKSRNYVKYIFWISLVEFLFLTFQHLYHFYVNNNEFSQYDEKTRFENNPRYRNEFRTSLFCFKIFSFLITAGFVLLFYVIKNKVECNLKKFILQIIKFKKRLMLLFSPILFYYSYNVCSYIFYYSSLKIQNIHLENPTIIGFM
jgi:hypothetical protein